jgi:hypothetical protein
MRAFVDEDDKVISMGSKGTISKTSQSQKQMVPAKRGFIEVEEELSNQDGEDDI